MSAIRLDDEQMRRFICDGVLVLNSTQNTGLHQTILDKLQWVNTHDSQVRNNILPRVSELQQVLDSPSIKGALQSILGDDYMMHPHRLLVPSEPLAPEERNIELQGHENGPPVGEGSRSFSIWHKDKLGRTRYHVPRVVFLFYFPQDTPVSRGPTRVIPGSQYHDHITEADHPFAYVPDHLKAGSCMLTAIDIEHAGMSNLTDQTRHMVKFNFLRTRNPQETSWHGGTGDWEHPGEYLGRYEHYETWSYVWDWMRGCRKSGFVPASDIDQHLSNLNCADQQKRLAAIYSLGAMGEPALEPLLSSLKRIEGKNRPQGFMALLDNEDPWIVLNAAFALGETASVAARAVPRLSTLLKSSNHRVVCAVLESIACIGSNTIAALPDITNLFYTSQDTWEQNEKLDYLVADNIHFNAIYALLLSDLNIKDIEDLLIDLLESPATNVGVPALALEILIRGGGQKGTRHAIKYLQAHRWDDTSWPE